MEGWFKVPLMAYRSYGCWQVWTTSLATPCLRYEVSVLARERRVGSRDCSLRKLHYIREGFYSYLRRIGAEPQQNARLGERLFRFCFPPSSMIRVVISNLQSCRPLAILIVPDTKTPWFPSIKSAAIRSRRVAANADPNILFRKRHCHGRVPVVFDT